MRPARRDRGFSIIEMCFAVIILGAVFLLALKGRDLVVGMKALSTGYQLQQFQTQVLAYQTEYKALPGDDRAAPKRHGRENAVFLRYGTAVSFTGDNRIDGKLSDVTSANGEQFMAWRDLRFAGLINGDAALVGASAMPENPFGGVFGFDEGNLGQSEGSICATRVPGAAALRIDARIDDGVINTGKVVGTQRFDPATVFNHYDEPDSQPYNVEKEYIICVPLLP